jgi:hypothetical protein
MKDPSTKAIEGIEKFEKVLNNITWSAITALSGVALIAGISPQTPTYFLVGIGLILLMLNLLAYRVNGIYKLLKDK